MIRSIIKIAVFALTFFMVSTAVAQTYPVKPVRIMAATPGSTADFMARYIGQRLNKLWNSPVIVENRSGASATLAATAVAQAEPDGHTLLMGETGSLGTAGILYQKRSPI